MGCQADFLYNKWKNFLFWNRIIIFPCQGILGKKSPTKNDSLTTTAMQSHFCMYCPSYYLRIVSVYEKKDVEFGAWKLN